ncbi:fumarylacetoacetate hydrolase family protein [Isachenkonia alkalipeptolytica]|uniref:Fumarylacetoacetate hydrolase family protein n=1 Tax=Isachenkonia alkalipeptolytica TaxID=2565777 RepID=A0AA44BG23_9CLOT|nr:fumarylacetoacetate hydrolase family protein [Isachenkonia alkalipeptolytica]NBG89430.1 fumarylacetoacetate hydrolase family protein [Isachenkonia alkalipeptolytica]
MKFVTVKHQGKELPGVLKPKESAVYFLRDVLGEDAPNSLLSFIQGNEVPTGKESEIGADEKSGFNGDVIEKIRGYISDTKNTPVLLDQCEMLAPIPRPLRNIICLGMNYQDHVKELKGDDGRPRPIPKVPVYFGKMASEIIGTGGVIELHEEVTNSVDYEVELAAIIGKSGRDIPIEKAFDHIFGYTIMNDVTARDLQSRHQQFIRGKSLDTFTAMGPTILHRDFIKTPVRLDLSCEINGELRQSSNTKNFIFDLPYIISDLSRGTTLQAGDIIATGTPGGVGKGFTPPKYLKSGDRVVCEIESIGTLWNKVAKRG